MKFTCSHCGLEGERLRNLTRGRRWYCSQRCKVDAMRRVDKKVQASSNVMPLPTDLDIEALTAHQQDALIRYIRARNPDAVGNSTFRSLVALKLVAPTGPRHRSCFLTRTGRDFALMILLRRDEAHRRSEEAKHRTGDEKIVRIAV